jgi:hypothetical protein
MRSESELLRDVIGRLNATGIEYMLTGSMASNYWGIPRTTHDLDFVLVMQPAQVERFVAAFAAGFFLQPESIRAAFAPPFQFNVLDEQSALKVDFWLLHPEAFEQNMFARRQEVLLFDLRTWVATAEDSILHKLYWNRITPSTRQIGDAAGVFAVQGATLSASYLRQWATHLGVEHELEDLLAGKLRPKTS